MDPGPGEARPRREQEVGSAERPWSLQAIEATGEVARELNELQSQLRQEDERPLANVIVATEDRAEAERIFSACEAGLAVFGYECVHPVVGSAEHGVVAGVYVRQVGPREPYHLGGLNAAGDAMLDGHGEAVAFCQDLCVRRRDGRVRGGPIPGLAVLSTDPGVLLGHEHRHSPEEFYRCSSCAALPGGQKVFIGYGQGVKTLMEEVRDTVEQSGLTSTIFDDGESMPEGAGRNKRRLSQMIAESGLAVLLMTPEDEQSDGTSRARQNVVHEVGLCQGHLGFEHVVILRDETCAELSNLDVQVAAYPPGGIHDRLRELETALRRSHIGRGDPVRSG